MVGFELSRFVKNNVSILPEHICKVCQLVMNNPVQCSKCKIWICHSCIENACTHCECAHTFAETNKFMKSKIDDLTIKCIFCTNGCPFISKVSQIDRHEKTCEFKTMICQSKNCIQDSTSQEVKHAKDCGLYPIVCEVCKKPMRLMELKTHRCIEYLLEAVENLERKNKNMGEETIELRHKNEFLRKDANVKIVERENTLAGLNAKKEKLTEKNNQLRREFEAESVRAEEFYQKELAKFLQNTKNKLKNFGKKAQNESSGFAGKMNKKLEGLLQKTNENLSEFNSKVAVDSHEQFNINVEDTVTKLNESRRK